MESVYVKLDSRVTLKLKIWDTAGQERFSKLTSTFIKNLDGVLLVFDLADRGSFENITKWRQQITDVSEIPIVVVANKVDLLHR